MLRPEEITQRLRARFERDYPHWARGRGTWPMRINLQPPTVSERSADPIACHRWAAAWKAYTGPGEVHYAGLRFSTATHAMPKVLILAHPSQAAALHPQTQATWQRCGERLVHLQHAFPQACFDGIIRRVTELDERDYRRLADTVQWLSAHPTSGLLLRQLPIEGIDTKWLAKHRVLVLALLGDAADDSNGEGDAPDAPEEALDDSVPTTARLRLHQRLGLRTPPELIQVAVLDPALRAHVGGMRHFAASIDDLNRWPHHPHTVIMIENKETGYAITEDHPGTVVLHGQGFNVAGYARITWIRSAQTIIYWGDIDAPGLQFVSDLRGYGIPVTTVLMDTATLDRFRHLSTNGAIPQRAALSRLTASESAVYARLVHHADTHHDGLLLEQERIPWPHAYETLTSALHEQVVTDSAEPSTPVAHD
ncbi:Wadjet anti-phage system protein JetD domain-containing protein [Nonomuraea sp. H19]|uniref:Wadjet anti-phage system protein JetD domain-containing protein n=1 Tax=Nonomuraea sp. H19 TaxID=3452206 RepID=UPI003F8AE88A